jgi:hypothetical protein
MNTDELIYNARAEILTNKLKTLLSEESFYEIMDAAYTEGIDLDDELFEFNNFYPEDDKLIHDGAWIMVYYDKYYHVYYAKKANRKYNPFNIKKRLKSLRKDHNILATEINTAKDRSLSDIKKLGTKLKTIYKKIEETQLELNAISIFETYDIEPYYVKVQLTKSKYEYYLPSEYKKVSDINLYINAVRNKQNINSVKFIQLYDTKNEDKIFYLRSRGIPEAEAKMLVNLTNGYFKVNVNALFSEYLIPVK